MKRITITLSALSALLFAATPASAVTIANLSPPKIVGVAHVGGQLTVTPGVWSIFDPFPEYTWARCSAPPPVEFVDGQTCIDVAGPGTQFSGYYPTSADIGFLIDVLETVETQGCSPPGCIPDRNSSWAKPTARVTPIPPPPVPSITSRPAHTTTSTTASFKFSDRQKAVKFVCSLDGNGSRSFHACTSPKLYHGLRIGAHTFKVVALWSQGPVNPSVASGYSWKVKKH